MLLLLASVLRNKIGVLLLLFAYLGEIHSRQFKSFCCRESAYIDLFIRFFKIYTPGQAVSEFCSVPL